MQKLLQICREEFGKAAKTIATTYGVLKEIDTRTMAALITFLRLR
jgi:hypothetical protein